MEAEEINKRKKAIALFMCAKIEEREYYAGLIERCAKMQHFIGPNLLSSTNQWIPISRTEYDTSFDWLLPVVLKMQAQTQYFIGISWHRMDLTNGETGEEKSYKVEESPLSTLFEVVSDCCLLIIDGNKKEHESLLRTGMFFEMYPQLTGDWTKDKEEFIAIKNKTY